MKVDQSLIFQVHTISALFNKEKRIGWAFLGSVFEEYKQRNIASEYKTKNSVWTNFPRVTV